MSSGKSLHFALVGYGRMGQAIARTLQTDGVHRVTATARSSDELRAANLSECDVAVDFTEPNAVIENAAHILEQQVPLVIGTTGWYDQIEQIKGRVEQYDGALIYSPNFSLGTQLFFRLIAEAGRLADPFNEYDPLILEIHHRRKKDSPSGTALRIGNLLIDQLRKKSRLVPEPKQLSEDAIQIASARGGSIYGQHTVSFDSPFDTIELAHRAKSLEGFAKGAILAAEWIIGRQGLFHFEELIDSIVEAGPSSKG